MQSTKALSAVRNGNTPSWNKIDDTGAFRDGIIKHINNGSSVEGDVKYDSALAGRRLFQFRGLVYRSEGALREEVFNSGFKSKNDLSNARNYQESTGIGLDDGRSGLMAVGATGQSGVSTAKEYGKCKAYGRFHYVIDTRMLSGQHKAFDIESNTRENGLAYDGSSEVNITEVPNYAIVGIFEDENQQGIKSLPSYWEEVMCEGDNVTESMNQRYQDDNA